jgi:hypothetical protein
MLSSGWMIKFSFSFGFIIRFDDYIDTIVFSKITSMLSSGWIMTWLIAYGCMITLLLSSARMITFSILFDDIILLDENVLVLIWLDDTFLLFSWCYHLAV